MADEAVKKSLGSINHHKQKLAVNRLIDYYKLDYESLF
jgi:hypothetical protein